MTSKKYMIQPLTPPRQQRRSSALSILTKYTNSTRTNEYKKRSTDHIVPTLPFSPYSASFELDYSHYESGSRTERARTEAAQDAPLETDLKVYRAYCKNERVMSESMDDAAIREEEEEEEEETADTQSEPPMPSSDMGDDFASWRRAMNSQLATKRRQIRSEKRRVKKEEKEKEVHAPPAATTFTTSYSSPSSPSSTPTTSPHKPRLSLFSLSAKLKSKKEDHDTPSDRFSIMSIGSLKGEDNKVKSFRQHKKSSSEPTADPRLFQTVRTPLSIEREEEEARERESIIMMNKSKSMSPRNVSPAKSSPRNNSPAKVSPRSRSPAKGSPRNTSPVKLSPRNTPCPSTPPSPAKDALATPRDTHGGVGGKRVPRNAVSVSVAT